MPDAPTKVDWAELCAPPASGCRLPGLPRSIHIRWKDCPQSHLQSLPFTFMATVLPAADLSAFTKPMLPAAAPGKTPMMATASTATLREAPHASSLVCHADPWWAFRSTGRGSSNV